jgi:hypothetical protein
MSKAITDIINRLEGDLLALQGYSAKFSPPHSSAPTPNMTFDQPVAPPQAKPTRADYDYVKKLLDEVQGLAKSASEEVDKELKVPPPPSGEAEAAAPSSASGSSKTK